MADHENRYLEFTAPYSLGVLDGDDVREFESHLKDCQVCKRELSAFSQTAGMIPMALPPLTLSPDLKERVMFNAGLAQVTKAYIDAAPETAPAEPSGREEEQGAWEEERPARRKGSGWLAYGLAFAGLVMLVGFSMYVMSLFKTLSSQDAYIATQQAQITRLLSEVDRRDAILKVLGSRRIEIVTMDGLGVNPVGYGKILWDPEKKVAVLQVSNLPPVPTGKDYQLWIIKNQKPVSAGIFAVTNERERESFFQVQPIEVRERSDVDAFAVTLEPKGGVPQPTGEMYLLGKASAE